MDFTLSSNYLNSCFDYVLLKNKQTRVRAFSKPLTLVNSVQTKLFISKY